MIRIQQGAKFRKSRERDKTNTRSAARPDAAPYHKRNTSGRMRHQYPVIRLSPEERVAQVWTP